MNRKSDGLADTMLLTSLAFSFNVMRVQVFSVLYPAVVDASFGCSPLLINRKIVCLHVSKAFFLGSSLPRNSFLLFPTSATLFSCVFSSSKSKIKCTNPIKKSGKWGTFLMLSYYKRCIQITLSRGNCLLPTKAVRLRLSVNAIVTILVTYIYIPPD